MSIEYDFYRNPNSQGIQIGILSGRQRTEETFTESENPAFTNQDTFRGNDRRRNRPIANGIFQDARNFNP